MLPTWNDGPAKAKILAFLSSVATPGSPQFVPAAERVAVFDNDGTLWCEKPAYAQELFLFDRLKEQAASDPQLAANPVMKALLAGDLQGAAAQGMDALGELLLGTHAGLTAEEFAASAQAWFDGARHPRFGVKFGQLAYLPMLELLAALRAHDFQVFIVTGGGVEFVRAISEEVYGVAPAAVIGSAVQVAMERRGEQIVVVRQAKLQGAANEGAPKVERIQSHIGQRPIFAAGNSAGDREMLEYVSTGSLPSLALVLNHDDDEREYQYSGASVTDPHAEPILKTAAALGWLVASMREDWAQVFAHQGPAA